MFWPLSREQQALRQKPSDRRLANLPDYIVRWYATARVQQINTFWGQCLSDSLCALLANEANGFGACSAELERPLLATS